MTPEEFVSLGRRSLLALDGLIDQLMEVYRAAPFWAPEGATGAILSQIETLRKIKNEIGPRLLNEIEAGNLAKIENFKRLIKRARDASLDIMEEHQSRLSVSAFIKEVIGATVTDAGEVITQGVKKAIPAAFGIVALLIIYNVTKK